jgi:hypothetical protein
MAGRGSWFASVVTASGAIVLAVALPVCIRLCPSILLVTTAIGFAIGVVNRAGAIRWLVVVPATILLSFGVTILLAVISVVRMTARD